MVQRFPGSVQSFQEVLGAPYKDLLPVNLSAIHLPVQGVIQLSKPQSSESEAPLSMQLLFQDRHGYREPHLIHAG